MTLHKDFLRDSYKFLGPLITKPSAWVPMAMSLAALVMLLGYLAIFGVTEPQEDEGTAAHLFQLLMGGQLPIIAFFALKWLPQMPKQALFVLTLQFLAGLAAFTPVYLLEM
ncbi:MAG: hypothetical protein AAB587_02155 [Patescibacteria group bacterium]